MEVNNHVYHEKVISSKRIIAYLLDILFTLVITLVFFFGICTPIINSNSSVKENNNFISQLRQENFLDYEITKGTKYEDLLEQGKKFYEKNANEILQYYDEFLVEDSQLKGEKRDIHYVFNVNFLKLPENPDITSATTYENAYFTYSINKSISTIIYSEFGKENGTELGERGIEQRYLMIEDSYYALNDMLLLINPNYVASTNFVTSVQIYARLASGLSAFIIIYIIVPLCLKYGKTPAKLIYNQGFVNSDTTPIKWYKTLLRAVCFLPFLVITLIFFNLSMLIIFLVFPIFLDMISFIVDKYGKDAVDKITRVEMIDTKASTWEDDENTVELTEEELEYSRRLEMARTILINEEIKEEQNEEK